MRTAEDLDGLPSTAEMKGCEHFEGRILDSPDCKRTAFARIFRVAEKSEEVRQSDFGVRNLPANVSSSELSPHQMGGSLAGTVRFSGMLQSEMDPAHPDGFSRLKLKSEPVDPVRLDGSSNVTGNAEDLSSVHCGGSQTQSIGTGTSGMLGIEGTGFLSISDRALLRKFKSLETARENFQQVGIYKKEVSTSVSRDDGHPLKPSLSLCDRALLRKYPGADSSLSSFSGTQSIEDSMLPCSPIWVPSPPVVNPMESAKERKRYVGKGNTKKANIGVDVGDKLALPTASCPRSQSLLFPMQVSLLPQF